MARHLELPEEVPDTSGMGGTVRTHPAFGVLTVTKTSGGSRLFGSALHHSG